MILNVQRTIANANSSHSMCVIVTCYYLDEFILCVKINYYLRAAESFFLGNIAHN